MRASLLAGFLCAVLWAGCGAGTEDEPLELDETSALPEPEPPDEGKSDWWSGFVTVGPYYRGTLTSPEVKSLFGYRPEGGPARILLSVRGDEVGGGLFGDTAVRARPVVEVWRRPTHAGEPYTLVGRAGGLFAKLAVSVPEYGSYYVIVIRGSWSVPIAGPFRMRITRQ